MLVACPTWPPLPNNTVELPQLEDSDSSPVSTMPPDEQSSPAMSYYSTSMLSTTMGTTPNDGWPLSSSTSLSTPDYSPYALGLTCNPAAATTYNPYECNYLPTAVPTGMPPSSSASTANCTRPIDAFGAAPPPYDLHWVNDTQPRTRYVSLCTLPDSLAPLRDTVGRSHPMRRRPPPFEPHADPVISKTAPMELSLADESLPEVAPRKRSRTAQACKRCCRRKARCFGGDPCNRCVKRKSECEFTSSRQLGLNKPLLPDLPIQNLILHPYPHPHPQSHTKHSHARPQANPHVHPGVHPAPVPLARALTNAHSHSNKHKVRRHSVHSFKPASTMMMPQIPSVFRLLPMHTTAIPHPEPPALGLGLELNPAAIDEYADGKSDPDFGNPSSAPVFVSNSNTSTLWGSARDPRSLSFRPTKPSTRG
ncbi:hypothetical protein EHS25_007218 [Saitozyma podzolica]|uniref:Zn(2)-C6 fungal-type domain-containing protein n=1 Tax=Saitozyma podzolica TaxID=1890683 RepID=A0A427XN21_9TREE|nr:hypothetical protein EHS25_007218 [Saitozyma podzolica]